MTKVLVVDDSALMRRVLSEILRSADFEVATAKDGLDALDQLESFAPDVVTLDVQMPRMDGLECLNRIMVERPCPVVMVSSLTTQGAEETLTALELGAVDFLPKPDGAVSLAVEDFAPIVVGAVRDAAKAKVRRSHRLLERLRVGQGAAAPAPRRRTRAKRRDGELPGLVVVGTSTGGPPALDIVLGALPEDFAWPVVVAQHMPAAFTRSLAMRLDRLCALPVSEVTGPTLLEPGQIYIARGDADMILSRRPDGLIALPAPASAKHRWHPSVDRLTASAMDHMPAERLVGVLMTGMGNDGATAMAALRTAGGRTIAESEETAVVWGMPGELVRADGADFVEDVDAIAARLIRVVGR